MFPICFKNVGRHFETWKTGITGPVMLDGLDKGKRDLTHQKWSYQVLYPHISSTHISGSTNNNPQTKLFSF